MRPWENQTYSKNRRAEILADQIPFFFIRNREIHIVDAYIGEMFWVKNANEGLAPFHFKGIQYYDDDTALEVYMTDESVETAWQKEMKKFYDETYKPYKKVLDELDEFRDNYQEMFI